jgi:WXG100 family type VII secretion target
MARITVTPEQVHDVARQFETSSQQSQEMVNTLQTTMNQLDPEWEGMTAQRFYQEYQSWRQSMTQFVELLNQIGQELHAIADRFAAADQQ